MKGNPTLEVAFDPNVYGGQYVATLVVWGKAQASMALGSKPPSHKDRSEAREKLLKKYEATNSKRKFGGGHW